MEIIFGIIVLVLGISIYDYMSSRKWQQITSTTRNEVVFEHRNREYGAYVIRRDYNSRMIIIMLCVTLSIGIAYGIYRIIKSIPEEKVPELKVDDKTFAVAAPPAEEEEVPPPPPEEKIPEMEKTIQFTPPVIRDAPVENPPPDQSDLSNANAGNVTNPGNGFGGDPPPSGGTPDPTPDPPRPPETVVDEYAEFPGGKAALNKFLNDNFKYPQTAVEEGLEGKCYVRFVVDTDGNISEAKVVKKVPNCKECDAEALRVVNKMPKWVPAKKKGNKVASYFSLPIEFALD